MLPLETNQRRSWSGQWDAKVMVRSGPLWHNSGQKAPSGLNIRGLPVVLQPDTTWPGARRAVGQTGGEGRRHVTGAPITCDRSTNNEYYSTHDTQHPGPIAARVAAVAATGAVAAALSLSATAGAATSGGARAVGHRVVVLVRA
jgi:hypothetical protein